MNENKTIAYIEYESSLILVKIGDWVKEKSISFEHSTNLSTAMFILIDENCDYYFYQTLTREYDKTHESIMKQIKNCKENTEFHYIIDEFSVEMKIFKTRKNIAINENDYFQLKQQILEQLTDLNSISIEALIFSEINHDDLLYSEKYIQLYLEAIEDFVENNRNPTLSVFTIFINPKCKDAFFSVIGQRQSKYTCFSFITLN